MDKYEGYIEYVPWKHIIADCFYRDVPVLRCMQILKAHGYETDIDDMMERYEEAAAEHRGLIRFTKHVERQYERDQQEDEY